MPLSISPEIVTSGGTKTLPYGDALTVTRHLSQSTDWQYSVRDLFRELSPEAASGDWAGVMDDAAYGSDGLAYAKHIEISGTDDTGAWALPHGIPDAYGYGLAGGDPHETFTWKGKGVASILYRPNLSLPTVISTKTAATGASAWSSGTTYAEGDNAETGGTTYESLAADNTNHTPASSPEWWQEVSTGRLYYVQEVLTDIFDAYGLTSDVTGVEPNYLVARMPRQDSAPIEWITQLLEPVQGEWYEDESGGIVCFVPANIVALSEATAYDRDWSTEDVGVQALQTDLSAVVDYANIVTVQRADDTGGVLAAVDQKGAAFGRQSLVTLSQPTPVNSLHWIKKLQNIGQISDVYVYGPAGPPAAPIDARELKGAAPTLQSGSTAYSVDFTFGAWTGSPAGATSGDYSLEFRGDDSYGVYADNVTSIEVQDATSIASGRGKMRAKLGPNLLLADQSTMQTWGERYLYKRARKRRPVSITIWPADYSLRPGHRVRVTDAQFGVTRIYTVETVGQTFPIQPADRKTTVQAVTYER